MLPEHTRLPSPPGLANAIYEVRHSSCPLAVYWRHMPYRKGLHGDTCPVVIALPRYHKKPSFGILVGIYDGEATGQEIREGVFRVIHRYASGEEI